jgi:hypothetical protein
MRIKSLVLRGSWRTRIFAGLVLAGLLDWVNVSNPCEWPLLRCPDYPFRHHPQVTPGLYPPLIFDEGCVLPNERIEGPIGWECRPSTWSLGRPPGEFCQTRCRVSPFSWVYTVAYWWLVSSVANFLVTLPSRWRARVPYPLK